MKSSWVPGAAAVRGGGAVGAAGDGAAARGCTCGWWRRTVAGCRCGTPPSHSSANAQFIKFNF